MSDEMKDNDFLDDELNNKTDEKQHQLNTDKYKKKRRKSNLIIAPDMIFSRKTINNGGGWEKQNVEDERGI